MQTIDRSVLTAALAAFDGHAVYMHVEVTPGGFARNIPLTVEASFVHGDGPFRVALRLPDRGWIRVEGLTHMTVDEMGRLLLAGHDSDGKLTTALELSPTPFA
jgi:hypothetical protein